MKNKLKLVQILLKTNQGNLQVSKRWFTRIKYRKYKFKNRLDELEKRNEELYAQVNAMV